MKGEEQAGGIKNFLSNNWFNLITFAMLFCGAVYQVGFQARNIQAFQLEVADMRRIQADGAAVVLALQKDVDRLQWDRDRLKSDLDEIKLNGVATGRQVNEMDKKIEAVLQILKLSPIK